MTELPIVGGVSVMDGLTEEVGDAVDMVAVFSRIKRALSMSEAIHISSIKLGYIHDCTCTRHS